MVIALLGYVGTMLAALVALVMVWHQVLGPSQREAARQPPRPIGAVVQAAPPALQPGTPPGQWGPQIVHKADATANADDAVAAAAQAAALEKAKRQKLARVQKRKEQLARQRDDQQYALGYDQEAPQSNAPPQLFNFFGQRRF
jgi:uncharacterized membrane protein YccC